MSVDDALFFEQASTSLYEKTDDPDDRCVLSLARAKAKYCTVDDAVGTEPTDKLNEDAQPEIVVQLRKHKGQLQVFLDGFLSEVEPEDRGGVKVHVHKLTWHRGLHEDVQSDTRVFSPLAIVAAVEDGQRPLQDVTVSVWTTFENQGVSLFNNLLVSETRLVQHHTTDARCHTVRAPYPLAYPPAPTVVIFDRMKINRQTAVKSMKVIQKGLTESARLTLNLYRAEVENMGSGRGFGAGPIDSVKAAVAPAWNWFSETVFGNPRRSTDSSPPETAGGKGFVLPSLLLGGVVSTFAAALKANNWYLASAFILGAVPSLDVLYENLEIEGIPSTEKWYKLASAVTYEAMMNLTNEKPQSTEGQTKFTIKELTRTIWSLATIRKNDDNHTVLDEFRRKQSEHYRREQVVWEWLLDGDDTISPIDDSLLGVSKMFTTRLNVRITVDDALGCTPSAAYHEISCDREDCNVLGAIAAGGARDLDALLEAILGLEATIDKGIEEGAPTWSDLAASLKEDVFRPAYEHLRDTATKVKDLLAEEGPGAKENQEKLDELQTTQPDAIAVYEALIEVQNINHAEWKDAEWQKQQDINIENEKVALEAAKKLQEEEDKLAQDPQPLQPDIQERMGKIEKAWSNLKRVQIVGMFTAFKREVFRKGVTLLQGESTPFKEKRKKLLENVKAGIRDKLYHLVFDGNSKGQQLYTKLHDAAADKKLPIPKATMCKYVRMLPHRASSANTRRLFLFRADSSNGYVDLSTEYAATRVYSELYDANQSVAAAMDGSAMALSRLVREWEGNSLTRVKLVCRCKEINSDAAKAKPFQERIAFGTLVLTTPVDVQVAGVLATPTEYARRQIRMVMRRAQQKCDKSVLERLGLEDNDASLLVSHVFGDLWSEELVTLHKLGTKTRQVQMLEQASRRAAARLRHAGQLILDLLTVHNPSSGVMDFDDVPCNTTDISLVATRRGRDAGMIVERLLFGNNYVAIRAAFAPLLRAVARAAAKCADAFERSVPEHLPHEPVASLFGDPFAGVAAYVRVRSMSSLDAVVSAAVAAYPAVLLLDANTTSMQAIVDTAQHRRVPEMSTAPFLDFGQLVKAMRYRLASLKMDALPLDEDYESHEDAIDQLAEKLSVTSLETSHSFYVPFGFGDACPAPTLPPLSAPMFGSVTVFGPQLVAAFGALQKRGGTTARPYRVVLRPTLGCLRPLASKDGVSVQPNVVQVSIGDDLEDDLEEGASVHPNVVQVSMEGDAVVVRYTASRVRGEQLPKNLGPTGTYTNSSDVSSAAKAHRRGKTAAQLAADVCSIAWNAERVMQAVVVALASANPSDTHGGIVLSLVLPYDDNEQSVWFIRPPNPLALKQQEMYTKRFMTRADMQVQYFDRSHRYWARKLISTLGEITKNAFKSKFVDGVDVEELLKQKVAAIEKLGTDSPTKTLLDRAEGRNSALSAITPKLLEDSIDWEKIEREETDALGVGDHSTTNPMNARNSHEAVVRNHLADLTAYLAIAEKQFVWLDHAYKIWNKGATDANKESPTTETDNAHAERVRAGLVCALGVGMGMLSPLLGKAATLHVDAIQEEDAKGGLRDWNKGNTHASSLEVAFGKCRAMRMSEACLVVAGVI